MKQSIANAKTLTLVLALVMSLTLVACGAPNAESANDNSYGKVDWSTAEQGYITFTAKGQERCFILQGPGDSQTLMDVQDSETVKVALADGAGSYQYAIADRTTGENSCKVQYKSSFNVSKIDTDLADSLSVTPYCG